jgi:hypothetical protein
MTLLVIAESNPLDPQSSKLTDARNEIKNTDEFQ